MLFLIFCLMHFPLFVVVLCLSVFWYALLCILSGFATILNMLKRKRHLVALLYCLTDVLLLEMFCGSSSRCPGLVCNG